MNENRAKKAIDLLDVLTLAEMRELTDDELWRLACLLYHWSDLSVSERQKRIAAKSK
jgi:hypothetical protein